MEKECHSIEEEKCLPTDMAVIFGLTLFRNAIEESPLSNSPL
jgi:hypothetical protein